MSQIEERKSQKTEEKAEKTQEELNAIIKETDKRSQDQWQKAKENIRKQLFGDKPSGDTETLYAESNLTKTEYKAVRDYLEQIQVIGAYSGKAADEGAQTDIPLDFFDSDYHKNYISREMTKIQEHDLLFMINVAEHSDRPKDMLNFIGEYFKKVLIQTKQAEDKKTSQKSYYLTQEVINSLGIACKHYIEEHRQQLRIAIALSRSPAFDGSVAETQTQANRLRLEIKYTQFELIERCSKIFKFVDYLHDVKKNPPLEQKEKQSPPLILNAQLFKIKADYLRYIYECLSGDDGLLYNYPTTEKWDDDLKDREKSNVSSDTSRKEIKQEQHQCQMTLLEFMEHDTDYQYQLAMGQIYIFDDKGALTTQKGEEDWKFHPVFLTSLMNRQVFKRDVMLQKYREKRTALKKRQAKDTKKNQKKDSNNVEKKEILKSIGSYSVVEDYENSKEYHEIQNSKVRIDMSRKVCPICLKNTLKVKSDQHLTENEIMKKQKDENKQIIEETLKITNSLDVEDPISHEHLSDPTRDFEFATNILELLNQMVNRWEEEDNSQF